MSKKKNIEKKSVNLLPAFFRTEKNSKFLSSTVDQLIKTPELTRLDGYVGSKLSPNYKVTDKYISESSALRQNYQLEPALVIKQSDQLIKKAFGFDDLVNQVSYYGGHTSNLDRLFRPNVSSYDPHIDWDKFVNFREYFWMPTGPDTVSVTGAQKNTVSTYTVTESPDGKFFIFTPDGLTSDPLVYLYRGNTYVFNVNNTSNTFYIKTAPELGSNASYVGASGNGTKNGQVILVVDENTPSVLFYQSAESQEAGGRIVVRRPSENSAIDIDREIVGKAEYTSGNGVKFVNGLKVKFSGNVEPIQYREKEFIVEGVGQEIKLIEFTKLITPEDLATLHNTSFDGTAFDQYPFDDFKNIPIVPEYVTINRASKDLNPWSRYNRWFHIDVLTMAAELNGSELNLPFDRRASRPIVEFRPNIQLWNFGTTAIEPIDLVDEITTDAFSVVEKSSGYYIDEIALEQDFRVVFSADTDPAVSSKVYRVNIAQIDGKKVIDLIEEATLSYGDSLLVKQGKNRRGTEWWYNGSRLVFAQQRTKRNQAPRFDLFDKDGISYSDLIYQTSEFIGSKVFGYSVNETGVSDPVLGFPLKYKSDTITGVGAYLFENYFDTEQISLISGDTVEQVSTTDTYLRINDSNYRFENVWAPAEYYRIPVLQLEVLTESTDTVEVACFDAPALIDDLEISVFVDGKKKKQGKDYVLQTENARLFVKFSTNLESGRVLLKCYTLASPNNRGFYETPINLTNNPLNNKVTELTLSELSDHVATMVNRADEFIGEFPGVSNLRHLTDITKYGSRLVKNQNSLAFAQHFITDVENNAIDAIRAAATDYYNFKINLINHISKIGSAERTIAEVLDAALTEINTNKNTTFPYSRSDMLGYGRNTVEKVYRVTDPRNNVYPVSNAFSLDSLSSRSVIVYHIDGNNGKISQLVVEKEYTFIPEDSAVRIKRSLLRGDTIKVVEYVSTVGSYIPPTPTKLGIYPKFEPSIYVDNSFSSGPKKVIQGHDGSITIAFSEYDQPDEFRDLALLEYELRVFNNLKTKFNTEFLNIHDVIPSVFRKTDYSLDEINDLARADFIKWASVYGIDATTNSGYDRNNYTTYNYASTKDYVFDCQLPGSWRAIYKFYFDTDRPNTHPWEMLGFTIMPEWWESYYGPAPYTSGNKILWDDLEEGRIRQGSRQGIDAKYARPGLSTIIPVDDSGNVVDIRNWPGIEQNPAIVDTDQDWSFGNIGPAELAWRRSSLWPFTVQVILALSKPADFAARFFDPARLTKDIAGHYTYAEDNAFLSTNRVKLYSGTDASGSTVLGSGYHVWVVERGLQRSVNYTSTLKDELKFAGVNLFYKFSGFTSKDKIDLIIDSVNPTSSNPGVTLPTEDYSLIFNVSNPVKTASISGVIVEKKDGYFVLKGYDKYSPYFTILEPIYRSSKSTVTVGGKSEPFVSWTANTFYQSSQVVYYGSRYYRATISHNSGNSFNATNYQTLRELPIIGGVTVHTTSDFEKTETVIPYGSKFSTIQEVYNVLIGYGAWLESQGFTFNQYIQELGQVVDWKFTGKEFLYWTTQNWSVGTVITLSPFADQLVYKSVDSVVDNVLDTFYEYSLLSADGMPFSTKNFSLSREDSTCTITTKNTTSGLFFARLNLVQKEHAIVLNNTTLFNDIVYIPESGYRQYRLKISGFKTANWQGDFVSPGFVYDAAQIDEWAPYTDYPVAAVVKYAGKYYSANQKVSATEEFQFDSWSILNEKPTPQLLPNFDYKINQIEDFYSLDIDNFDIGQQKMAQHLVGYTPREYLDNIFVDQIAQYKFYQGFIREKGTRNAINKLSKASVHNLHGQLELTEEWAFRAGAYGSYTTFNEIEFPLKEASFIENSQVVTFVDTIPELAEDSVAYTTLADLEIKPVGFSSSAAFATEKSTFDNNPNVLPTAGYPMITEVTATAYNKNSLFDIANNGSIKEGDTIWLGFRDDGQWDVYRYTKQSAKVVSSEVTTPGSVLRFTTDRFHGLSVGDIVSVYGLDNGTDGVYRVINFDTLTSFDVESALTTVNVSETSALMYKFVSVRVNSFDDINKLQEDVDFVPGDIVWADSNNDGKWSVYQKMQNYKPASVTESTSGARNQQLGSTIHASSESNIVLVGAPGYVSGTEKGRVFVYEVAESETTLLVNFGINSIKNEHYVEGTDTGFGTAIHFDAASNAIFAGAPFASNVNLGANAENEGLVKISKINPELYDEIPVTVIANQYAQPNALFGSSVLVVNTKEPKKLLLVGAPGQNGTGSVFVYSLDDNLTPSLTKILDKNPDYSSRFGESIVASSDGSRLVVTAPGAYNKTGSLYVYTYLGNSQFSTQPIEILAPDSCKDGDEFGSVIEMTSDGKYLFVGTTKTMSGSNLYGKVFVYKWNNSTYVLNQTINNISANTDLIFGTSIDVNDSADTLIIGARGNKSFAGVILDNNDTIFDGTNCTFGDIISGVGSVFVFNRYSDKFVYSEELFDKSVIARSKFGESVAINANAIIVGAPGYNDKGAFYQFQKIDPLINSWNLLRSQPDSVDIKKIRQVCIIDSQDEEIKEWVDTIDPIKGKIAGIADQEVRYKTAFDPAVYSIGFQGTVVDTETSWIDSHVGELWWDLSSVKYVWYEQGDLTYRKNTWGTIFPGASIDVYEWVKSEYLPSQWSSIADTAEGLAQGISGQPKYVDNSAISVQQYYNATTGATTNVYYFWVKNKVTLPSSVDRRISAAEVARIIYDPVAYGLKTLSIISENSLVVSNVKDRLVSDKMHLNIAADDINSSINKHTEWLLIEENSNTSMPSDQLEQKLFDSLLGRDMLGNPVPDPSLSNRTKFGIDVRPRQTMFKNRRLALRNLIDYTNSVLQKNAVTDVISFNWLNSKEEIPNADLGYYDVLVETLEELESVPTTSVDVAKISCDVKYGKITGVIIDTPGRGYKIPPVVTISDNLFGAVIKTEINSVGEVVGATIVNPGKNFVSAPEITVRPFTAVVQVDSSSSNKWAMYQVVNKSWVKIKTQSFDTTAYWDYVDWIDLTYDPVKPLSATVNQLYELNTITPKTGDYVKVKNPGNGRYLILQKVNTDGNFSNDYNVVYMEKGTLQFKDTVWNTSNSRFNFDYIATYDQTQYDQAPDIEIANVLRAIKEDLFTGSLKGYWNKFFFKAVRYALSEQKAVDWAFKTSFVSVRNKAGELEQRTNYKFQDSQYYEQYLNEIKPYKTKIRNFTVDYEVTEPTQTYTTDFDLPAIYDKETKTFVSINANDPVLEEYPYKSWSDNYKLSVEKIVIAHGGSGYTTVPRVEIISAQGDTGYGATAQAYISAGKVLEITVTNPGQGYTLIPTVVIVGGNTTNDLAVAYAQLKNNKVRTSEIGLRFDRVSTKNTMLSRSATDSFVASGVQNEFSLSWAAEYKKSDIVVTINGIPILATDYAIDTFTKEYTPFAEISGYTKMYSTLILNFVPEKDSIIKITYNKNINLFNAAERVAEFYKPTTGMPGNDISQVMSGVEFPGTQIRTAPLSYSVTWDTTPYGSVDWDSDDIDFDTIIDGGNLEYTLASGVNPTDITIDGDKFLSSNTRYAPEELVPGEVCESVGISVYTRNVNTTPAITSVIAEVSSTVNPTIVQLPLTPPSTSSLMVIFDNTSLIYGIDYTVNFSQNTVEILPRGTTGTVEITVIGVGGKEFLSADFVKAESQPTMYVETTGPMSEVGSVYVTLNGTSLTSSDYKTLDVDGQGRVVVENLPLGTNTLQAWFFKSEYKGFSEVKEQIIVASGNENSTFTIDQVPGTMWSAGSQIIVELNGNRLVPYSSSYYIGVPEQTTYKIDANLSRPAGVYNLLNVEVYVNGNKLSPGTDFIIDQDANSVILSNAVSGDQIAITNSAYSEFKITDNQLEILKPVLSGDTVKIVTYTNQDSLGMRTEVFVYSTARRFKISREIISSSYAWVSVNGHQLMNLADYYIDTDNSTVVINESIEMNVGDTVVIISLQNTTDASVIGYRMFTDIFQRTTYKRLSKQNTTRLTSPLLITDTAIEVENAEVLSQPNIESNIPGVILIAGERIEYLEIEGNTLKKIKRATLGTGAKDYYSVGTSLVDQSARQEVPHTDALVACYTQTDGRTFYNFSDMTFRKGTQIEILDSASLQDQVEVFCGGVKLNKSGVVVHDPAIAYDSGEITASGQSSDVVIPPQFTVETNGISLSNDVADLNLTIIQKKTASWNSEPGVSLINDSTLPAIFLRDKPAVLPDKYHYG